VYDEALAVRDTRGFRGVFDGDSLPATPEELEDEIADWIAQWKLRGQDSSPGGG
jgi:hypothetical protein